MGHSMRDHDSQIFTAFGGAYLGQKRGDRIPQKPKKGFSGKIAALLGVLLIGATTAVAATAISQQPERLAWGIRHSDAAHDPLHRQTSRHRGIRRSPLLTERPCSGTSVARGFTGPATPTTPLGGFPATFLVYSSSLSPARAMFEPSSRARSSGDWLRASRKHSAAWCRHCSAVA